MEKKSNSLGEHLQSILLFPNDVKELYSILHSVNQNVSIETKDFIFKSLDELFEIEKDKINNLTLKINEPYVSIDLRQGSIWLYTSKDDHLSRGIYTELKTFLISKRRKFANISESTAFSGILIGVSFVCWFYVLLFAYNILWSFVCLVFFIMSLVYSRWTFSRITNWHTIIYLKTTPENYNFFKRKKDEILLVTISTLVGSVIGSIVTYL